MISDTPSRRREGEGAEGCAAVRLVSEADEQHNFCPCSDRRGVVRACKSFGTVMRACFAGEDWLAGKRSGSDL